MNGGDTSTDLRSELVARLGITSAASDADLLAAVTRAVERADTLRGALRPDQLTNTLTPELDRIVRRGLLGDGTPGRLYVRQEDGDLRGRRPEEYAAEVAPRLLAALLEVPRNGGSE